MACSLSNLQPPSSVLHEAQIHYVVYDDFGPKQLENDIDVYLSPLIEDLRVLWEEGVDVFDGYCNEYFKMRAMVFCTINDFPAYGNLCEYSVKGHKACPICEEGTCYHHNKLTF